MAPDKLLPTIGLESKLSKGMHGIIRKCMHFIVLLSRTLVVSPARKIGV